MNIMNIMMISHKIVVADINSDLYTVVYNIDIKSNNDLMEFSSFTIEICAS